MHLGKLINAYRLHHHIGVRTLAQQMGVTHTVLFDFERGHNIQSKQLMRILNWVFLGNEAFWKPASKE